MSQNPSGKYFVSVCCTEVEIEPLPKTGVIIGLDMGIKSLMITSDGTEYPNHKYLQKSQNCLAKLQRQLSRKSKGSNNRNKARVYREHLLDFESWERYSEVSTENVSKPKIISKYLEDLQDDTHMVYDSDIDRLDEVTLANNSLTGLSRMISIAARGGVPISELVDQLYSTGVCPSYAVKKASGGKISKGACCPMAVGNALLDMYNEVQSNICSDEEICETEQVRSTSYEGKQILKVNNPCPGCGEELRSESGCFSCPSCGFSKCE